MNRLAVYLFFRATVTVTKTVYLFVFLVVFVFKRLWPKSGQSQFPFYSFMTCCAAAITHFTGKVFFECVAEWRKLGRGRFCTLCEQLFHFFTNRFHLFGPYLVLFVSESLLNFSADRKLNLLRKERVRVETGIKFWFIARCATFYHNALCHEQQEDVTPSVMETRDAVEGSHNRREFLPSV